MGSAMVGVQRHVSGGHRGSRHVAGALVVGAFLPGLLLPEQAGARPAWRPPAGKVLLGVATKEGTARFDLLTRHRHHIRSVYPPWGMDPVAMLEGARRDRVRLMVHLKPRRRDPFLKLTLAQLARGRGDRHLIALSAAYNRSGRFVYVRPMSEMNGHWNFYCAFNKDGTARGPDWSTRRYRQAFQRIAIIMDGGSRRWINRRLGRLGLNGVRFRFGVIRPSGRVATVWNPQGTGKPAIPQNAPQAYWPGSPFVDIVAVDILGWGRTGRAAWRPMDALYRRYPAKPFLVGEWGLVRYDAPSYLRRMFRYAADHRRVIALAWFDGGRRQTGLRLRGKPLSLQVYRLRANAPRHACRRCAW